MKTLVFSIFFLLTAQGFSQPYVDMVMSVRDDETDELLDDVWVRFFRGDSLVDSDSSGMMMWGGDGHLKGFWLEYGHKYNFIISKEGYVTKTGEVDLTNKNLKKNKRERELHLSLFVTLFPYCNAGEFEFMKTTPLIKIEVNDEGEQTWDRDYVKRMQKRIDDARHANIPDEDYAKYESYFDKGTTLLSEGKYKEAKGEFMTAQKYMNCYPVQRAITECEERMAGLYDEKTLLETASSKYEEREFDEALRLYTRYENLFDPKGEEWDEYHKRLRYLRAIVKADKFMLARNLRVALNYYEMATWVFEEGDQYAEGRIELINSILGKE